MNFTKPALLVLGLAALVPAMPAQAQDVATYVGLSCASVNAMTPAEAAAFLFGYEAGFMDALDPEGPTSGTLAPRAADVVTAPPTTTEAFVSACAGSPNSSVAQALASRHAEEDPISLVAKVAGMPRN
jgi:hypothetical protein